jgi:hypothetical protein
MMRLGAEPGDRGTLFLLRSISCQDPLKHIYCNQCYNPIGNRAQRARGRKRETCVGEPVTEVLQWLLISHILPCEPSAPRVALWRKLKKLGAVLLYDALYTQLSVNK